MTEKVMKILEAKFGGERLKCWICGERIKVGDKVISKHAVRGRYKICHKECYKTLITK